MNEDTIKVTQLPSAETITQNDLLMIVQNNENKKATSSQMVDLLSDEFANYYDKDETDALLDAKADITDVPTKVSDLTNDSNFVSTTDYASNSVGGVIKAQSPNGLATNVDGYLYPINSNYATYQSAINTYAISKGTLENVFTGKGFIDKDVNNLTNYTKTTDLQDNLVNVSSSVDTDYRTNILSSKNLFDGIFQQGGLRLGSDGGEAVQTNRIRSGYVAVKPNTTYIISSNNSNIESLSIGLYKNDYSYDSEHKINNGDWLIFPYTFTTLSDTRYVRFAFRKSNNSDITPTGNYEIQLEYGSTATTYEPFIQKTINVDNNKFTDTINVGTEIDSANRVNILQSNNLFKLPTSISQTLNGITYTLNSDGSLTMSGTANANTDIVLPLEFSIKLDGTYTFSLDISGTITPVGYQQWILRSGGSNTSLNPSVQSNTIKSVSATLSNTIIDGIRIYTANNAVIDCTIKPMLNEGSTPLQYEPYITPSINVDGKEIYNSNIMNYSTNEQVIGKWIDGKPLYRKVIDCGYLPNNTSISISSGLTASTTRITNISGVARDNTSGYCLPIPHINTNGLGSGIQLEFNTSGAIFIRTQANYSSLNGYVILEYTKTTD